jgi:hypothetical protein
MFSQHEGKPLRFMSRQVECEFKSMLCDFNEVMAEKM